MSPSSRNHTSARPDDLGPTETQPHPEVIPVLADTKTAVEDPELPALEPEPATTVVPDGAEAISEIAPEEAGANDDCAGTGRGLDWRRLLAYGVLPALVVLLALVAGLFKFWDTTARESEIARVDSMQAAKESTIAMLSYQPGTVEKELTAAQGLLTGAFRDSYAELTHDVVIPGAKQKHISTVASVPAAASVSATPRHAVVLLFINQAAIVGGDAPTDTASSVRVTLDKIDGRWLIAGFDPI
ncbi:MAG: hypothetical protein ABI253_00570 [Mycobacterium sp.]